MKELLNAARDLSRAATPQQFAELLASHPVLFQDDVDTCLTQAIQRAQTQEQLSVACSLLLVRAFLAAYANDQRAAFYEWGSRLPFTKHCPLSILTSAETQIIEPLVLLKTAQWALTLLRAETEPYWWAAVHYALGQIHTQITDCDENLHLLAAARHYGHALRAWRHGHGVLERQEIISALDQTWNRYVELDLAQHYAQAVEFYTEILAQLTDPATHYERAMLLHSRGNLYCRYRQAKSNEQIELAIADYKESLAIRTELEETAARALLGTQLGLANAYVQRILGDHAENIEQAITIYETLLKNASKDTVDLIAQAQYNLAVAYRLRRRGEPQQNIETALHYINAALGFYTRDCYPERWAMIQNELATLYSQRRNGMRTENLEQAQQHYNKALEVYTPVQFPRQWAQTKNNLGNVCCDSLYGDPFVNLHEGIQHYEAALTVRLRETYPHEWAETQNNLGTAYADLWARGDKAAFSKAENAYQQALAVRKETALSREIRQTAGNLGQLYFAAQDWPNAKIAFDQALAAADMLYLAAYTETSKQTEIAEHVRLYHQAAFVLAKLESPQQAWLTLEHGKTRLLAEALHYTTPRPAQVPLVVWESYVVAQTAIRTSLRDDLWAQDQHTPLQSLDLPREEYARAAHAALQTAVEQVRHYAPDFMRSLEASALQSCLPDTDTAMIAFCITQQSSWALVATKKRIYTVPLLNFNEAQLNNWLFASTDDVHHPRGWVTAQLLDLEVWKKTVLESVLHEIGQTVLLPILRTLPRKIRRLVFLPSGGLFLLPLHAARLSSKHTTRLVDKYEVRYAPSLEVLLACQKKDIQGEPNLYAVINPTADQNLVFTAAEGAALFRIFGTRATLHQGAACTKAAVLQNAPGHSYIHFASHGYYSWENPAQSYLQLADDVLTLSELQSSALDLSMARLVTLSACHTGISDILVGSADEYVGLPAGFMLAGVPCVVSSLWAVWDLSTALLMEHFYGYYVDGQPVSAALRQAQQKIRGMSTSEVLTYIERYYAQAKGPHKAMLLQYLKNYQYLAYHEPETRPFEHPYYWAAFTVNGFDRHDNGA